MKPVQHYKQVGCYLQIVPSFHHRLRLCAGMHESLDRWYGRIGLKTLPLRAMSKEFGK